VFSKQVIDFIRNLSVYLLKSCRFKVFIASMILKFVDNYYLFDIIFFDFKDLPNSFQSLTLDGLDLNQLLVY